MATEQDKQIGLNVAILRGSHPNHGQPMTQQVLAAGMRERGHKWSQATVWSVEKGERPLRLAEADTLAQIFKVPLAALADPNAPEALNPVWIAETRAKQLQQEHSRVQAEADDWAIQLAEAKERVAQARAAYAKNYQGSDDGQH